MKLVKEEDERFHKESKKRYDFWLDRRVLGLAQIEAALRVGKSEPDLLPHPDDIELDWKTLSLRILGAMDEEGRATEKLVAEAQDFGYEMLIYMNLVSGI